MSRGTACQLTIWFIFRSAVGDATSNPNKRLQQTQAQVDEVVGIMKTNVEKVLERDQKLSELDDRADALQQGASQFEVHAAKLKRKYWWQNLKVCPSCPARSLNSLNLSLDDANIGRRRGRDSHYHRRYVYFIEPFISLLIALELTVSTTSGK